MFLADGVSTAHTRLIFKLDRSLLYSSENNEHAHLNQNLLANYRSNLQGSIFNSYNACQSLQSIDLCILHRLVFFKVKQILSIMYCFKYSTRIEKIYFKV